MTTKQALLLSFMLILFESCNSSLMDTFAGIQSTTGSFGGNGGKATSATFKIPTSNWVNSLGEMFVADNGNNKIRKIDSSGIVSAYFGGSSSSVSGDGGAATAAQGTPYGVTGDSIGNLYLVDSTNTRLRRIDAYGIIYAVAGGGTLGGTSSDEDNNGPATSSYFNFMTSAVVDTSGDIYVVDSNNNKIKKITTTTMILTIIAGTGAQATPDTSANNGNGGMASSAKLSTPLGSYLDSNGVFYFASYGSGVIRKINLTSGIISLVAGGSGSSGYSGDGGAATTALLQNTYVFVGGDVNGNIFYANSPYNNVRWISGSTGIIDRFAGSSSGTSGYSGDGGEATQGLLRSPFQIFVYDTVLYISETDNNIIRSVTLTMPTISPSTAPTISPTITPSALPTVSILPSVEPTFVPTTPTIVPTITPSVLPSVTPTIAPTVVPTINPSEIPTVAPSILPTISPSIVPSLCPSVVPSLLPTIEPSIVPSCIPSIVPTATPTIRPSALPSSLPTSTQSCVPSRLPSLVPSFEPFELPTGRPSREPSMSPSMSPSQIPTNVPSQSLNPIFITFDFEVYLQNVTVNAVDDLSEVSVFNALLQTLQIGSDHLSYMSQDSLSSDSEKRRLSDQFEIVMYFNLWTSTAEIPNSANQDASFLYDTVVNRLLDAVESISLTLLIRKISLETDAYDTINVYVASVEAGEFMEFTSGSENVSTESDSSNDDSLSGGETAGIVVGGFVFILCLVEICVLCLARRKTTRTIVVTEYTKTAVDDKVEIIPSENHQVDV